MIRHIVFFSLKNPGQRADVIGKLERLGTIPGSTLFEVRANTKSDQFGNDIDVVVYSEFPDLAARRPRRRLGAIGRCPIVRIDPAGKQVFEALVDARMSEAFLDERVEAERRQVPLVEDDRMPESDRARVVGVRPDEIEQLFRAQPVATIPVDNLCAVESRGVRGDRLGHRLRGRYFFRR